MKTGTGQHMFLVRRDELHGLNCVQSMTRGSGGKVWYYSGCLILQVMNLPSKLGGGLDNQPSGCKGGRSDGSLIVAAGMGI